MTNWPFFLSLAFAAGWFANRWYTLRESNSR